jgi:hypothetical protein
MANTAYPNVASKLVKGNGESGYIIPAVKPITDTANHTSKVSYTGTAGWNTGDLLSGDCVGLLVYATTDCYVIFSSAATVTVSTSAKGQYIPGGSLIQLPYGGIQSFSAIQVSAGGDIYVTEITPETIAT